jgi:hypothetical protein
MTYCMNFAPDKSLIRKESTPLLKPQAYLFLPDHDPTVETGPRRGTLLLTHGVGIPGNLTTIRKRTADQVEARPLTVDLRVVYP